MAWKKAAMAVLVVLALGVAAILLVRTFRSRYISIVAYTDDAGGLSEGTPVRLNGISIGELDKLILTTSRDPKRKIEMVMKVQRRALRDIPADSMVGEAATNLLGNYFINIIQGRSPQPVEPGGELRTTVAVDPNKLMGEMASELQQIQAIFARADKLIQDVNSGQGNIGMLNKDGVTKLNRVSDEFNKLADSVRKSNGNLSKVDDLNAQMDATEKRLNDVMSEAQSGRGTAAKLQGLPGEISNMTKDMNQLTSELNSPHGPSQRLTSIQESFEKLTGSVQSVVDHINSGQGTIGQLSVNPQFSEALAHAGAEFQALAKGVRTNPRKFLSFSIKFF
jgi:phospholipid/cholesterol/gamma-HCH transport system substrate-binding protein